MTRRSQCILVAIALFACCVPTMGQGTVHPPFPDIYTDPLLWDDVVIKGTVSAIEYVSVPREQWYAGLPIEKMPSSNPVQVMRVRLVDLDVLRGPMVGSEFIVDVWSVRNSAVPPVLLEQLATGDTLIVTGWYRSSTGGYVATTLRKRHEEGWVNILHEGWRKPVSEAAIRERVASVSVENLTMESDLIVRGRIVARHGVPVEEGGHDEYELVPEVVLKGEAGSTVRFIAGGGPRVNDESRWRMKFVDVRIGSTCYLLLKRQDDTYVPTAGWRAVYKVDGNRLLERAEVPSRYSPGALEERIKAFAVEQ